MRSLFHDKFIHPGLSFSQKESEIEINGVGWMRRILGSLACVMALAGGWAAAAPATAAPGYTDVALSWGTGFGCPVNVTNTGTAAADNVFVVPTTPAPVAPRWVGTIAPGETKTLNYGDCYFYDLSWPQRIFAATTSWDVNWDNNNFTLVD